MTDAELAIVVKLKDLFSTQLDKIVANTDKSAVKMESSWKKLTNGVLAAKAAVAGWLTGQVARFATDMISLGAKVERANVAFEAMTRRIGVDATDAIERMRTASGGAVADLDLMAAANRAIMLGAVKTGEALEKLTRYGTKLGNAMGLSAAQGIDYFTTGLARQQTAILDNVGLIVDLEKEYKRLGKTADELNDDERRSIFSSAVWRAASEGVESLGTKTASLATNVDRMAAAWSNAKARAAEYLALPFAEKEPGKTYGEAVLESMGRTGATGGAGGAFRAGQVPQGFEPNLAPPPPVTITEAHRETYRLQQELDRLLAEDAKMRDWEKGAATATEKDKRTDQFKRAIAAGNRRAQEEALRNAANRQRVLNEQEKFLDEVEPPMKRVKTYMDTVWEGMADGAKKYYDSISDVMLNVSDCIYDTFRSIEYNLGDVFFDAMMGKMKTFKDYMRAFVQDIARMMSQLMARQALGSLFGAIGGLFGGGAAAGSPGQIEPSPGYSFGAEGNLGSGVELLQHGGITNGPAIAGEAGTEAVVPLPGARAIPVEFKNGNSGTTHITYVINAIDSQSFAQALLQSRTSIHRIVAEGFSADQQLRSAVRAV